VLYFIFLTKVTIALTKNSSCSTFRVSLIALFTKAPFLVRPWVCPPQGKLLVSQVALYRRSVPAPGNLYLLTFETTVSGGMEESIPRNLPGRHLLPLRPLRPLRLKFRSLLLDDQLLARDAIPAPRYRGQSIHADVLAAMETFAKRPVVDAANGRFHQLQQAALLRLLPEGHFL
jgi:hypothetical protein